MAFSSATSASGNELKEALENIFSMHIVQHMNLLRKIIIIQDLYQICAMLYYFFQDTFHYSRYILY